MIAPSKAAADPVPPWQRRLLWMHSLLALLLIVWRPLIATPDHLGLDHQLWHTLLVIGYALLAWEWAAGWRQRLYWGWAGILAAVTVVALIPAWLRAANPAAGIGFMTTALGQLMLAGYLSQIVKGRERLLISALMAALTVLVILAIGQKLWVLPEISRLHQAGDLTLAALPQAADADLQERLSHGGVYATYTIANALAISMVAGLFLAIGWMISSARQRSWIFIAGSLLLAAAMLTTLSWSASKGGWLSLLAGGFILILSQLRGRLRYLLLGLGLGAILALVILGPVLDHPSVQVRLGYWQAALSLWLETPFSGLGWEAYAHRSPSALPVWGEWSRRTHNEILEALVAGGLWAALALAALFARLLFPPRLNAQVKTTDSEQISPISHPRWLPWTLPPLLCYAFLLGTLSSDNLSFWPHGHDLLVSLGYTFAIGVIASGTLILCLRCPTLHPRWQWAGLIAIVGGCLIDFHLHETGIIAIVIVLACGLRLQHINIQGKALRRTLVAGSCAIALIGLGFIHGSSPRRDDLLMATHIDTQLQQALRTHHREDWQSLARFLNLPPESAAHELAEQAIADIQRLAAGWPSAEPLLRRSRSQIPDPDQRIHQLEQHRQEFFDSLALLNELAKAYAQRRMWNQCLEIQRLAVRQNPWHLATRMRLIHWYQAVQKLPQLSNQWPLEQLIQDEMTTIRELNTQVHGRHRIPSGMLPKP